MKITDLPQPFGFYRVLTGSDYLHFGYWQNNHSEMSLLQAQEALSKLLLSRFPKPPLRILDVGCGLGVMAAHLVKAGYQVVAIAPSEHLIRYAEHHHPGPKYIACGFLDDHIPPLECYDIILFQESLQYFPKLSPVFEKVKQLLEPSQGRVIFCDEVSYSEETQKYSAVHEAKNIERDFAEQGFFVRYHERIGPQVRPTCEKIIQGFYEKRDELSSKIRILNPLQTLETYSDEAYSSIPRYGNSSVYERKLPLNETDAELIRIVKDSLHCLSDWKFLQVRTEEIDDNAVLSYVLAFQYRGNKDPYSFRKKQSEDNWKNPDFSAEFIEELGLSELGNRLPKDLTDELIQISHNYSFIIIDNIHDNIELFQYLRSRISNHKWIQVLYLSRYYKTFDDFDTENIYKIIDGIPFFKIDSNENFEEKVSGIIWKKTKLLIEKGSQLQWRKGDFKQVLNNINRNLLKLNIALRMWEQKNSHSAPLTFDKIDSKKILQQFFSEHKLNLLKSDALLTYCLLFKNDIAFVPLRNAYEENSLLREKGIILQYFKSDFCFFSHKEYARLIFDSYDYIENGISIDKKIALIKNYIQNFDYDENNIGLIFLLAKFQNSEEKEIIGNLLNDEKVKQVLLNELSSQEIKPYLAITTLNIIFLHSEKVEYVYLKEYYEFFLTFFKSNKLSLYIEKHYLAYTRLLQLSNILNIELNENTILVLLRKNEKANTNSIVELTLRISKKSRESETILRILHSFDFSEWLKMITDLPRLSNITNCLSELNTSSVAKKLLVGLMRNINWENQYKKAKSLKIDQFVKSLREINGIDISIGTNISWFLFQKALNESLFKIKLNDANLSEYSKSLSDLSKIDPNFVKNQLTIDLRDKAVYKKFSNETSISNFTARALELRKLFKDEKLFFELISSIVTTEDFIRKIETETSLNYLLIFTEFAEKYLNLDELNLSQTVSNSITRIIKNLPNKLEALSNPKFLNINDLDSDFVDSITTQEIEKYFKNNKITYAEDLFRVLSSIDKDKTIEKFDKIDNTILVRALLNPELNFSQALEDLYKLKNKVYKSENLNCNEKISSILNEYLTKYTRDNRRYSRVNISDFFKGYYFASCINISKIEHHCKDDLLNKLKSSKYKNIEISSLFQFLRRISNIYKNELDDKLMHFLELNTYNFIDAIRNEDIIKTLSGLCELALTKFDVYGDELLYKARKIIVKKVAQRKRDEIYRVKLIPDLEKIAKHKGKIVLKELN